MGCDIHMFCEERVTVKEKTEWMSADHFKKNHYFGIYDDESELEVIGLCDDRNYSMFTALCGVRDYSDKSPKISEPKGLPDDVTKFVKETSDEYGCDGHSHSYVTLSEVKDFVDKNEPIKFSGLLSEEQSEALDRGELPKFWCQGSSLPTIRREWEDNTYEPLKGLLESMAKRYRPYWKMENLNKSDMDKFRIVFWFDN